MPVYYERGGSRGPDSISHEIMLFDALDASHARLPTSSLAPPVITSSASLAVPSTSSQKTSFVVTDYKIFSLTIVDDTIPTTDTHDDVFDTTVLDKPEENQPSGPSVP
ncbi:hypothetical protein Tco_0607059 [Tanacetum coccineum]